MYAEITFAIAALSDLAETLGSDACKLAGIRNGIDQKSAPNTWSTANGECSGYQSAQRTVWDQIDALRERLRNEPEMLPVGTPVAWSIEGGSVVGRIVSARETSTGPVYFLRGACTASIRPHSEVAPIPPTGLKNADRTTTVKEAIDNGLFCDRPEKELD